MRTHRNRSFERRLRRSQTDAESRLWLHLRARRFFAYKFRRQHRIGPYFVDFVCLELKLVVELDGSQHVERSDYDERRTRYLEHRGYRVLRFWDHDVLVDTNAVLEVLRRALPSTPQWL